MDKRSNKPTRLHTQRRMGKSKEIVLSVGNADTVSKNALESFVIDLEIRHSRTVSNRHTVLVTKLDSEKVVVVAGIFSKNAIGSFWLWTIEEDCAYLAVNKHSLGLNDSTWGFLSSSKTQYAT